MGRPKHELKRIHRKKMRKAKKKVGAHCRGETPLKDLTRRALHFLEKKRKQSKKTV